MFMFANICRYLFYGPSVINTIKTVNCLTVLKPLILLYMHCKFYVFLQCTIYDRAKFNLFWYMRFRTTFLLFSAEACITKDWLNHKHKEVESKDKERSWNLNTTGVQMRQKHKNVLCKIMHDKEGTWKETHKKTREKVKRFRQNMVNTHQLLG